MSVWRTLLLTLIGLLGAGCTTHHAKIDSSPAIQARVEIPEGELLDVGIHVFAYPASDEGEEKAEALETEGIEEELEENDEPLGQLRKAEAHFIPYHLRNTLQGTGFWGAVRVTPIETEAVDLMVHGRVVESDGEKLVLEIEARDAAGRVWLEKTYARTADAMSYRRNEKGEWDAYQAVYNAIANDLLAFRRTLTGSDLRNLRKISELKYAHAVAPDAFRGYLLESENGSLQVSRLPARNDPMMARMRKIREREYMFVDTVNEHYAYLYDEMWDPYHNWRKYHYEEAVALKEVRRKALVRKILGVAAVAGAVALELSGNGGGSPALTNLAILGGVELFRSGLEVGREAEIHVDAIRELSDSFESEIAPQVMEVEGRTVELTGSAQTQFAEWRRLLQKIYRTETGFEPASTADRPDPVIVQAN